FCRQRKGFWSLQEGPRITTTVHAVPRWDLMPPPDLTRNAPILDVSHPGQVVVRPLRWNQADLCGFDGLDRRPGQRLNFHEPLRRKIGFHHRLAAVALAERHGMVFDPGPKAALLQGFHYESPRLTDRLERGSSGCVPTPVSPNEVSGRVGATVQCVGGWSASG